MKPNLKTTTAAVALAGLIGVGVYVAVPAGANSPRSPAAASAKHPKPRHLRGIRGVHGEATVKRKEGFAKVSWQRGELTALTGTSLTVRSADGTSWTWTRTKDTKVRENVAVTAQVLVFGPLNGTTRTAKAVIVRKKK